MWGYGSRDRCECEDNVRLVDALRELRDGVPDGSKLVHVYKKAIRSICALSEPLLTPKAALKLNGVGPYIVQKLRPVFAEIAGVGDAESPAAAAPAGQILPHQWGTAGHGLNADTPSLKRTVTAPAATQRRGASTRSYTPVFGKAPWAVLMAAWGHVRHSSEGASFSRHEVEDYYEGICDVVEKDLPHVSKVWTSATRTLAKHGLLAPNPSTVAAFSLTSTGTSTAEKESSKARALKVLEFIESARSVAATLSPGFAMPTPKAAPSRADSRGSLARVRPGAGGRGSGASCATPPLRRTHSAPASGTPSVVGRAAKRRRVGIDSVDASGQGSGAGSGGGRAVHSPASVPASVLQHGGVVREVGHGWVAARPRPRILDRWQVVLLLDNREKFTNRDRDFIGNRLAERGVKVEVRELPIGDIMWVVRPRGDSSSRREFVTNYLIERKQIADLEISIRNGRYDEQKYRMRRCGLSRLIYLVEGNTAHATLGRGKSIPFAMIASQIFSGMLVQHTTSVDGTIDYLCTMHRTVTDLFADDAEVAPVVRTRHSAPAATIDDLKDLAGRAGLPEKLLTYPVWSATASKASQRTMSLVFGQQLCQIKGVGHQRAEAILAKYRTVSEFVGAINEFPNEKAAVAELRHLRTPSKGTIGPNASKILYRLYTTPDVQHYHPPIRGGGRVA